MHFRDEAGRTIVLRGVNLADGKFPLGKSTYHLESLEGAESCSYINSFFTLPSFQSVPDTSGRDINGGTSNAHQHLTRLRYLGFNILRVPVVWEALEHAGPGIYDDEYIEYVAALVQLCASPPYNFRVIINPHQDLWSRFAGGSGAPLWTLHACGLDERYFAETQACIRYAEWPPQEKDPSKKKPHEIPPMIWTTNHNRLASMTLFALFYGGNVIAPKCRLRLPGSGSEEDNENIQEFLQRHYFAAYGRLMARLGDLPFAYDSMNEPEPGYIELKDLDSIEREDTAKIGNTPTPIQGMRLGMGMEQEVDEYRLGKTGPHKKGKMTISPGRKCWLTCEDPRWEFVRGGEWPLGKCVWALHGIWDTESGELLQKDYFHKVMPYTSPAATRKENERDGPLSFVSSYWQAFHQQWTATVRKHSRTAISLIQPCVFSPPPPRQNPQSDDNINEPRHDNAIPDGEGGSANSAEERNGLIAYSPHYYDGLTVMHRHWHKRWNADVVGLLRGHHKTKVTGLRLGKDNVRKAIRDQLGLLANDAPDIPTLIGEMGIPFNMDDGKAYRKEVDPESGAVRNGSSSEAKKDNKGAGDYTEHVKALDAVIAGCDAHLLNYTLWAYSTINTHEWGDHWNGEDLSIHCAETGSFPDHEQLAGFRAAAAWCRPFVEVIDGGELTGMEFDVGSSKFLAEIDWSRNGGKGYALVYVPWLHYRVGDDPDKLALEVDAPKGTAWKMEGPQQLRWELNGEGGSNSKCKLKIQRAGRVLSEKELGTVV